MFFCLIFGKNCKISISEKTPFGVPVQYDFYAMKWFFARKEISKIATIFQGDSFVAQPSFFLVHTKERWFP